MTYVLKHSVWIQNKHQQDDTYGLIMHGTMNVKFSFELRLFIKWNMTSDNQTLGAL